MLKSVLIANRGEIACRIIRTAQRLKILTVVVYSEVDAASLAVEMSDESFCIGSTIAAESYLNIPKILDVALKAKVEAIHPGYGFLSENESLAKACADAGITFIGPTPHALKKMGSKSEAKEIAQKEGIPVISGYQGDQTLLPEEADRIGYPLMIKPVMGGGGKGMHRVDRKPDFKQSLAACEREAQAAFGNGDVLLEKVVDSPRHIEVQIFGDSFGKIVHLFERDCTLQRRYQKVIEEAPSSLPDALKEKLFDAALKIGHAVDYVGAGTVEFLVDSQGHFYFLEMNTRLQVEHPVTESITGLDLVEWQFRVASGEKLPLSQKEIVKHGHALELRLYAEDPAHNFKPMAGPLWIQDIPSDIRVDTGFKEQDRISPYYDPLIAKLILKGEDRQDVFEKAKTALGQITILGLKTNASFLKQLTCDPSIIRNQFDVGYIDRNLDELAPNHSPPEEVYLAASLIKVLSQDHPHSSPWEDIDNWRLQGFAMISFEWATDEGAKSMTLTHSSEGWVHGTHKIINAHLIENKLFYSGKEIPFWDHMGKLSLFYEGETYLLETAKVELKQHKQSDYQLNAPLTGKVVVIDVNEGDRVTKGQSLVILEAMKMEHLISAPHNGVVRRVCYKVGDVVNEGAELIDLGDI